VVIILYLSKYDTKYIKKEMFILKRTTKNIICIILILLIATMNFLTINYAKENINNKESDGKIELGNNNSDNMMPPDRPDGNSDMKVPSKPDEDSNAEIPDKPDEDSNAEIPDKPDEDSNMEMPDRPNDNQQEQNKNDVNKPDTSNIDLNKKEDNTSLTYIYYIIFGITNLVIAMIIIYLIMSKFNKKTFKETFSNSDKIIINILAVIILTVGFTYIDRIITTNLIENNSLKEDNPKNDNNSINYSSKIEITENKTITNETYSSENKDENTILVSGDINAEISDTTITKTGDSDGGDNTSFYGTNSAITVKDKANVILKNLNITTDATGANGVFSYGGSATTNNSSGDGTKVTISDSTIITTKDNSGGIMTTGGGNMIASNLTITTSGISSAAIRSDRGGGIVSVDGGTYTTNGQGSPAIYSTASITVNNAKLVSNASEGVVIEGKNSITLNNVELIDTNNKLNGKSTTYKNIFLYQSMSGDAANGISEFTSINSKITTNNGDTIYVTNTKATINLTNNIIINNDENGNFLRIQSDSWGISGSNGGDVDLILNNQDVEGNIVVDNISSLNMKMTTSSYEGSINNENSGAEITLAIDKDSTLKLTGDSYITKLDNEDSTNSNIDFNGYKLYVDGKQIN